MFIVAKNFRCNLSHEGLHKIFSFSFAVINDSQAFFFCIFTVANSVGNKFARLIKYWDDTTWLSTLSVISHGSLKLSTHFFQNKLVTIKTKEILAEQSQFENHMRVFLD